MKLMPRKWISLAVAALAVAAVAASVASAGNNKGATLPAMDPAGPRYTTQGGAQVLPTDRTIPHWHSQFTDPTNGQTYGYNMVGNADPRLAGAGTTTIPTDITPLNLVFQANGGYALNGTDVVSATVGSPLFKGANYAKTSLSTGGPGELSKGNSGVQYEDAIMRSQFNKQGTNYHLLLGQPSINAPVTISVPQNQGFARLSTAGVPLGLVDITWFSSQIQNLLSKADATHLPIYLTNNVMLYIGDPGTCCVIGFHGASKATGNGGGSIHSNGNTTVQTYVFAAYLTPGTFNPAHPENYYVKDIHPLSHEVAEWTSDPFVNNYVNPWKETETAPQYGCSNSLETGEPVVGIGFTLPGNSYDTNAYSDGYWHPEDEVFLPWFARESPNVTSQALQHGITGRYTFMGELNPYPGFQVPATGC